MSDLDIKHIIEQSKIDGPRTAEEVQTMLNNKNVLSQDVNSRQTYSIGSNQYLTEDCNQ